MSAAERAFYRAWVLLWVTPFLVWLLS